MLRLRKADERGHLDHGWLKTWHSFSFGEYRDPEHMGFRSLRVLNEDIIAPGQGFGTHPHRDMEILTYVIAGELEHKDSMGNGSVIRPGVIQRMSAGTGVLHSEFNPSSENPTHLIQIWVLPDRQDRDPGYEELEIPADSMANELRLIASGDGAGGSMTWGQDARLYAGRFEADTNAELALGAGRGAWVQLISGDLRVLGQELGPGDALAVESEPTLKIEAVSEAEFLVFDLNN